MRCSAVLYIASLVTLGHGLNILIWSPTYGQSHVNFMSNIANILQGDGHNVTMLLVENDRDVHNTAKIDVKIIRYVSPLIQNNEWSELHFKMANIFHLRTFELGDYLKMENMNYRICKSMLSNDTFLTMLEAENFDVVFIEMFHFCPAGIAHISGIPKIVLTSALGMTMAHYELTGLPITLSNTPAFLSDHSTHMTFPQRFFNVLYYFVQKALYLRMYYSEQWLFSRFYDNFPDLYELYKTRTDYILLNTNEFTDPIRPLTSNVKYIGGANINDPKGLSSDIEKILRKPSKGVIVFSLGSIVKSEEMPTDIRNAFLDAFHSFPDYIFLWKDDLAPNTTLPNVHYLNWLPQVDLLADSRTKLFITHGGMNSIQESLYFGVPMVIMPIFADQDGNAALASERGYAIQLNKFSITKKSIVDALTNVLGKPGTESTYTQKARQAARILKDSPSRMRDVVKRIALITGQEPRLHHLIVNSDMPIYQYYNIDVYLYFLLIIAIGCLLTVYFYTSANYIPVIASPKKLL